MIELVKRIRKRKDHVALLAEAQTKANHMEIVRSQEGKLSIESVWFNLKTDTFVSYILSENSFQPILFPVDIIFCITFSVNLEHELHLHMNNWSH